MIGVLQEDDRVPATGSYDLSASGPSLYGGPYKVTLIGWVSVADPAAGAIQFAMTHTDPAGVSRNSPNINGTLDLTNADSYFSTQIETIVRLSSVSPWALAAALGGSAGNARISYRLLAEPYDANAYPLAPGGLQ